MWFRAPAELMAEVFARLPDAFRSADASNEWVRRQPRGGPEQSLLEGPAFDRNGHLWCVDVPNGSIFRVGPTGAFTRVARYDGWPNGLKIHRDGRIFVADAQRGILLLDPASGTVSPYLVRANLEPFRGVNDLFFAANGDLYFTDQGQSGLHEANGRLFRLDVRGRLECLLGSIPSPNGLVMNREETVLYLAVTRGNCIWRVPLARDGGVVKVGLFVQLSGGVGPDGLALDAEGRLLIAHPGLGSVWVVDAHGEPVWRIRCPGGRHPTNLAFGGPQGKTLFITEAESGCILQVGLDVAGKPMFAATP